MNNNDESRFKMDILKFISQNRIFKDKDIADLRQKIFKINKKMASEEKIQSCWEEVLNELES